MSGTWDTQSVRAVTSTHQVPSSVLASVFGGFVLALAFCARPTASAPVRTTLATPAAPLRFRIASLISSSFDYGPPSWQHLRCVWAIMATDGPAGHGVRL